jgi:hypothetical protein
MRLTSWYGEHNHAFFTWLSSNCNADWKVPRNCSKTYQYEIWRKSLQAFSSCYERTDRRTGARHGWQPPSRSVSSSTRLTTPLQITVSSSTRLTTPLQITVSSSTRLTTPLQITVSPDMDIWSHTLYCRFEWSCTNILQQWSEQAQRIARGSGERRYTRCTKRPHHQLYFNARICC